MLRRLWPVAAVLALSVLAACGGNDAANNAPSENASGAPALYDPAALPTGPVGDSIRLGHDIITDTQTKVPQYVTARMTCAACHVNAGTQARGGTFAGVYARFPQWNKRAKRVITLQDRLAECFLYSMNGHPPAYDSKEMIAMVSYISYLSRNVKVLSEQPKGDRFIEPLPQRSPDVKAGATLYAQNCAQCHGANGAGSGMAIPPLWGPQSFNNGAGMAHIDRMTGFVHYNMPQNKPGSLSLDQSYDISAYVLTHARPKFDKTRTVTQESQPASYF